ncbi:MAG: ASCH domain-containing protein [Candidatus Micrarchaeia archaeon]
MIHEMRLTPEPFEKINAGKKTIEIRLYDEKRQKVKIDDIIIFHKLPDNAEIIKVKVIGLSFFKSFRDLFSNFDKSKFGHDKNLSIDEEIQMQRAYYSEEEEKKYGVIGIHIQLLKE